MGKYFEKVFEPPSEIIFPVGLGESDEREGFCAVNHDVFCVVRLDTKKGKMFLEMACQVLLRQEAESGVGSQGSGVGSRGSGVGSQEAGEQVRRIADY